MAEGRIGQLAENGYRARVAVVEDAWGRHEADERGTAQLHPVLQVSAVLLLTVLA